MRGSCEWDRGSAVWTTPGFSHARLARSSQASWRTRAPGRSPEPAPVPSLDGTTLRQSRCMAAALVRCQAHDSCLAAPPTEHADKTAASSPTASGVPRGGPSARSRGARAGTERAAWLSDAAGRGRPLGRLRIARRIAPRHWTGWDRPRARGAGGTGVPAGDRALHHPAGDALSGRRVRWCAPLSSPSR
jgi:hypothetical protein